jgi:UDP-sugar pyrophosphorylase
MQDYPKSLGPEANVGFSVVSGSVIFSPVKTNLVDARLKSKDGAPTYSAASGEADAYMSGCEMLKAAGVKLPRPTSTSLSGINVALGPRVVIDPTFAVGVAAWRRKLPTPTNVNLGPHSTLVLQGELRGLRIESLELSGTLVVRMCAGANVTLRRVRVSNDGWSFKEVTDGALVDEAIAIRGYQLERTQQREMVFDQPGEYVIEDEESADKSCNVV